MRYLTLVEQMASYDHGSGVFTFGDALAGRLTWEGAADGEGFNCYYRAASPDELQWEIGIGDYGGAGTLSRVTVVQSSTGSAVNFSGQVKLALVAPAGALWAIDGAAAYRSADAVGLYAMAAGQQAKAYGERAIALGFNAMVGDSGTPRPYGTALGAYAFVGHDFATALGADVGTLMRAAVHTRNGFWWSTSGYTDGDGPTLPVATDGSLPLLPPTATVAVRALVVARDYPDTKFYSAEIRAMVRRGITGAAALLGSPIVEEVFKTPGVTASATIAVDGVDGAFGVRVTGQAGEEWKWGIDLRGAWTL